MMDGWGARVERFYNIDRCCVRRGVSKNGRRSRFRAVVMGSFRWLNTEILCNNALIRINTTRDLFGVRDAGMMLTSTRRSGKGGVESLTGDQ